MHIKHIYIYVYICTRVCTYLYISVYTCVFHTAVLAGVTRSSTVTQHVYSSYIYIQRLMYVYIYIYEQIYDFHTHRASRE